MPGVTKYHFRIGDRFSSLAESRGPKCRYPSRFPPAGGVRKNRNGARLIGLSLSASIFVNLPYCKPLIKNHPSSIHPSIFNHLCIHFARQAHKKNTKHGNDPAPVALGNIQPTPAVFPPSGSRHVALYRRAGNFSGHNKTDGKRVSEGGNCKRGINPGLCQIGCRTHRLYRNTRSSPCLLADLPPS